MILDELPIDELARRMKANRDAHVRAALLIGLDGGAALLNSARPARILDALRGDQPPGPRDHLKMGQFWAARASWQAREDFLKRHTAPSDDAGPDTAAIGHLTALLRKRHLSAIVATDPAKYLYGGIVEAGLPIQRIDAVWSRTEYFDRWRQGNDRVLPVLVDGAELLIAGCEPTRTGDMGEQVRTTRTALQRFLADFDVVFSWGWCDLNVPFDSVYRSSSGKTLFILGRHSVPFHIDADYYLVAGDEREDDEAATAIFTDLANTLGLAPAPRSAAGQGGTPAPVDWSATRPVTTPPLLTVEELRHLRERVTGQPLTLVGIDGERTRRRTAEWLLGDLDGGLRAADVRGGGDLVSIGRWLGLSAQGPQRVAVGELYEGSTSDEGFWVRLSAVIDWWRQSIARERSHIVLFCPASIAGWAKRAYPSDESVHIELLPDERFLTEDAVREWITREVRPMVGSLDDPAISRLVTDMGERQRPPDFCADWLHDALDMWRQEIGLALTTTALDGTLPDGATGDAAATPRPPDLLTAWEGVLHRLAEATAALQPAFAIDPVPRADAAPPAATGTGFEIDPRPRTAPEAPDSGGSSAPG